MKAKDWLPKFYENSEKAVEEFIFETVDLIKRRSEKSHTKYKAAAVDGAIREQETKWEAIAARCTNIYKGGFMKAFSQYAADHHKNHDEYLKQKDKQGSIVVEEEKEGRAIATSLTAKRRPRIVAND